MAQAIWPANKLLLSDGYCWLSLFLNQGCRLQFCAHSSEIYFSVSKHRTGTVLCTAANLSRQSVQKDVLGSHDCQEISPESLLGRWATDVTAQSFVLYRLPGKISSNPAEWAAEVVH